MKSYLLPILLLLTACGQPENKKNPATPAVKSGPQISRDPELQQIIEQGGESFVHNGIHLLLSKPMDETGKSHRLTIYSDNQIDGNSYRIYTLELQSVHNNIREFKGILREESTGNMCDMKVTVKTDVCTVNWKSGQSDECSVNKWGFSEGETSFPRAQD